MCPGFVREPETLVEFNQQFYQITPISLFYDNTATNSEKVTKDVREFYFDDQPITMELLRNLSDVGIFFNFPVLFAIQM